VPDQRPPRLDAGERDTLLALLRYQRESFLRKMDGVEEEAATSSPVTSGTSLLWLTNHVADAEAGWVLRRFARRGDSPAGPWSETLGEAAARYRRVWGEVDAVIEGEASLDPECVAFDDQPPVNLRWIVAHLLEEVARHAGHADILRELIDGTTGR
jgi:Protein of unknown function (DUF664)